VLYAAAFYVCSIAENGRTQRAPKKSMTAQTPEAVKRKIMLILSSSHSSVHYFQTAKLNSVFFFKFVHGLTCKLRALLWCQRHIQRSIS